MNNPSITFFAFALVFIAAFIAPKGSVASFQPAQASKDSLLLGDWLRMTPGGPVRISFQSNGMVGADFKNDKSLDVVSDYQMQGDTLTFTDREGKTCPAAGQYRVERTSHYMALNVLEDTCNGRVKMMMGFWVKPDFQKRLQALSKKIERQPRPALHLQRARMYMAMGKPEKARSDLDYCISQGTPDARMYINRASTHFPANLEGVIADCNKAVALNPKLKNAYFLRGLAFSGLGNQEAACKDFSKAIALGFTALRKAEKKRCKEFWD